MIGRNCLVEADFGRMRPVKDTLVELTDELGVVSNKLIENHIMGLRNVWKEEKTNIFAQRMKSIEERVNSEYVVLEEIVSDIAGTSDNLYMAERSNVDLGLARRY